MSVNPVLFVREIKSILDNTSYRSKNEVDAEKKNAWLK